MTALKTVTVRLPEELHRRVKVRAAEYGDSLEGIARAAFVAYLNRNDKELGSPLERSGVRPVVSEGEIGIVRYSVLVDRPLPDEKKCSRANRHHIYHSGKPCPECGSW